MRLELLGLTDPSPADWALLIDLLHLRARWFSHPRLIVLRAPLGRLANARWFTWGLGRMSAVVSTKILQEGPNHLVFLQGCGGLAEVGGLFRRSSIDTRWDREVVGTMRERNRSLSREVLLWLSGHDLAVDGELGDLATCCQKRGRTPGLGRS